MITLAKQPKVLHHAGWVVVILCNCGDFNADPPVQQELMQEVRRLILG